jgi:hypothetical protein
MGGSAFLTTRWRQGQQEKHQKERGIVPNLAPSVTCVLHCEGSSMFALPTQYKNAIMMCSCPSGAHASVHTHNKYSPHSPIPPHCHQHKVVIKNWEEVAKQQFGAGLFL